MQNDARGTINEAGNAKTQPGPRARPGRHPSNNGQCAASDAGDVDGGEDDDGDVDADS